MHDVVPENRPFRSYAQPLAGLQVSWGSLLSGAVAALGIAAILWALGFAITMTATNASWSSILGALEALWIIAMATTLVGAFVGGLVAAYLAGNPRRIVGAAHGFLAWCVAFLVASFLGWAAFGNTVALVTHTATTAASAAVETTGAAVGGAVGGAAGSTTSLMQRAEDVLVSLGYTRAEAATMVHDAQIDIQNTLRGPAIENKATGVATRARNVTNTVIDWGAGLGWSWWGTWFASLMLAIAGGLLPAGRLRKRESRLASGEARTGERPIEPTPTGATTLGHDPMHHPV